MGDSRKGRYGYFNVIPQWEEPITGSYDGCWTLAIKTGFGRSHPSSSVDFLLSHPPRIEPRTSRLEDERLTSYSAGGPLDDFVIFQHHMTSGSGTLRATLTTSNPPPTLTGFLLLPAKPPQCIGLQPLVMRHISLGRDSGCTALGPIDQMSPSKEPHGRLS